MQHVPHTSSFEITNILSSLIKRTSNLMHYGHHRPYITVSSEETRWSGWLEKPCSHHLGLGLVERWHVRWFTVKLLTISKVLHSVVLEYYCEEVPLQTGASPRPRRTVVLDKVRIARRERQRDRGGRACLSLPVAPEDGGGDDRVLLAAASDEAARAVASAVNAALHESVMRSVEP